MERAPGNVPLKSTAGIQTNPSTATIVAEISSLAEGLYETRWAVGASTGAIVLLEHCLSTGLGSTAIRDQTAVYTVSNGSGEYVFAYSAQTGDRFRVRTNSSFTGSIAAKISAEPYL